MDCFLSVYEPLFLTYSVDLVFSGHVHAYERTHPMYQYASNACGPAYITIGDGGNIEGPYRNFVDELVPGTSTTFCANSFSTTNASYYPGVPSYQRAGQSSSCPTATFQAANGVGGQPGVVPLAGSSPPRYFCQTSQPEWSAYRDPSFGFGSLTFLNASAAVFTWYRNQDQSPGSPLVGADHAIYTRATSCASAPPPPPSPPPKKRGRRAAVIRQHSRGFGRHRRRRGGDLLLSAAEWPAGDGGRRCRHAALGRRIRGGAYKARAARPHQPTLIGSTERFIADLHQTSDLCSSDYRSL